MPPSYRSAAATSVSSSSPPSPSSSSPVDLEGPQHSMDFARLEGLEEGKAAHTGEEGLKVEKDCSVPPPSCCPWPSLGVLLFLFGACLALTYLLGTRASQDAGIVFAALLPNIFILAYCTWRYRASVELRRAIAIFLETTLWICPCVVLEGAWMYTLITLLKLPFNPDPAFVCGPCILAKFLASFTAPSFFEELAKYAALRTSPTLQQAKDPMALVVYGAWSGAAFSIMENLIVYDFRYGLEASLQRSVLPMHVLLGMLIGAQLGYQRFHARHGLAGEFWLRTLLMPVLIHGAWDFLSVTLPGDGPMCMAVALVVLIFLFLRHYIHSHQLLSNPNLLLLTPHKREGPSTRPSLGYLLLLLPLGLAGLIVLQTVMARVRPKFYDFEDWPSWWQAIKASDPPALFVRSG